MHRQAELPQVVLARTASRGLAGALHGGQQHANQRADDRDHDQEFHERERCRACSGGIFSRTNSVSRHFSQPFLC
jgi:hypothetical protein